MKNIAIVTGGTRGIGAAISAYLDKTNFKVIANFYNNYENALIFKKQFPNIEIKKWNVASYKESIEAIKEIKEEYKAPITALINNAGITRDKMMHKMSFEEWNEVININLTSCFNMCSAVINDMRSANYGRIINISSINAQMGQLGQTNYCAAKAGIIGFTKALARESASKSITVNAIAPGYIETDMLKHIPENFLNKIIEQIPLGRLGKAEEVANIVGFLTSKEASYVTGAVFSVNGGHNMG